LVNSFILKQEDKLIVITIIWSEV